MKKMLSSVAAMATLFSVSATAQEAPAQEENAISVEANVGYNSDFVWRGINMVDDAVLQSDIKLGYENFSLKIWGNNNLTDENEQPTSAWQFERVDYALAYDGEATEDIDYTVGVIRYAFPENRTSEYTTEVFAGASFDTFLNPKVTAFYDVDAANGGVYVLAEAGHAVEIYKGQNLDLGATLGLGDDKNNNIYHQAERDGFNFTDFALKASTDFSVNENVTITPAVTYAKTLDGVHETLFGGVNLNYVF